MSTHLSKQIEELRYDLSLSEYRNKILCEMVNERDVIIANLRKDIEGMLRNNKKG